MATAPSATTTNETKTETKEEMVKKMVPGLDVLMYMTEQLANQLGTKDPDVTKMLASWKTFRPEVTSEQPQIPDELKQYMDKCIAADFMKQKAEPKKEAEKPKLTFEYHIGAIDRWTVDRLDDIESLIQKMREKGMEGHVVFK